MKKEDVVKFVNVHNTFYDRLKDIVWYMGMIKNQFYNVHKCDIYFSPNGKIVFSVEEDSYPYDSIDLEIETEYFFDEELFENLKIQAERASEERKNKEKQADIEKQKKRVEEEIKRLKWMEEDGLKKMFNGIGE